MAAKKKTTPQPKTHQSFENKADICEELSKRFLRAEEMIKLQPLCHPRGKDGGWGH